LALEGAYGGVLRRREEFPPHIRFGEVQPVVVVGLGDHEAAVTFGDEYIAEPHLTGMRARDCFDLVFGVIGPR
jgi:hypothetical protein